jgi:branched-chain amino acid transport system substrate-binding protein
MKLKTILLGSIAAAVFAAPAYAVDIKIGVMNDRSGIYADIAGEGSVVAARMAVEDFDAAGKGINVEIVSADHQNKPDVGSTIARQWYDQENVDVIVDVPTSSVALAVNDITRESDKVFLNSGAATSDLTGSACSPNTIHWTYDTWQLANGTGRAVVENGGDSWFFVTADYAFGHALERDTSAVVEGAGGTIVGTVRTRAPTSRPSCSRRSLPAPRSSALPMPAATRSTRSSRRRNSASPRAASRSQVCSSSSTTSTRSASTSLRACS